MEAPAAPRRARRVRRRPPNEAAEAAVSRDRAASSNALTPAGELAVTPTNAIELQRLAGNQAVARAILVQRDGPDAGVATPPTTDAGAPAGGIAETPRQKIDRALRDRAVDTVTAITDFSAATDAERVTLIEIALAGGTLTPLAAGTVRLIWQSFGDRLPTMGVEQSALWDRCNTAGAALPDAWLGAAAGHRELAVSEQVGGTVYTATGAYDYRITADAIVVTVSMNFNPDAGVTVPVGTWFGYITSTWNRFDAVNQSDPAQKKRIDFRPVQGAGHNIQVSAGDGRANAAHYYAGDSRAPQSIPHEFGHLIGLEDEYERDAPDFARLTEEAVPAGSGETATAQTIARGIHDGLFLSERVFEWHSTTIRRREQAVQNVLAENHIVPNFQAGQNALTHEVSAQYVQIFGHEMSEDFMSQITTRWPWEDAQALQDWREQVLGTFQYTGTSIMGDMSDHAHPVAPRHVRAFAKLAQTFFGSGDWQPKER